ncbi:AbrB/MazE/SpoVT family DNA-binding domain-containing protein [Massilia sp. CCM 8694]|uniref:AbrB/MazE/SpoVT family DNA-binding domain-containing protein n=1 Tax=Massilia genomosp. 1 TaxID=2609280 RepID=A0ABX0NAA0_9BURK|nr:AbrB/MazE/SpoVT family DNA-binding domain-containing protein [Massilia genomosp. 1]
MTTTKIFQNGNLQAVRIPAEFAYEHLDIELEIERVGDELGIRPARRPLAGVLSKFARFGSDFMADGRGDQVQEEREALSLMKWQAEQVARRFAQCYVGDVVISAVTFAGLRTHRSADRLA